MRSILKLSALLGVLFATAGAAYAAPNLVTNGGFENTTPPTAAATFPSGSFEVTTPTHNTANTGTVTGWTGTNTGCTGSGCTGGEGNYMILFHPGTNTNADPAVGSLFGVTYNNNGTNTNAIPANEPSTVWNTSNSSGNGSELLSQGCGSSGAPAGNSTVGNCPNHFTLSANGGNFLALDGDPSARGQFQQTITGLTSGHWYQLDFQWAATQLQNRTGQITERLEVGFGSGGAACTETGAAVINGTNIQCTATLTQNTHTFSGWNNVTMFFKAGAVSQTLYFLSRGGPGGQPPIALLDGVSLVDTPEPGTLGILATGLLISFMVLRNRRPIPARVASAA